MNEEQLEEICFQIITYAGQARSCFVEALRKNRTDKTAAVKLLEEGNANLIEAEKVHARLIQQEASGNPVGFKMILMHAEDIMMSADTIHILAEEYLALF